MLAKKIVVCVVVYLICFNSLSQAGEAEEQALYNKAQKIIDEYHGDSSLFKKAQILFQEIEKINSNSKFMFVGYGRLLYKAGYINYSNYDKGSLEQSKLYFEKAISVDSNFFDAYFYGTYPYLFSKEYKKAKQMVAQAQNISPNSAKVDILLGEVSEKEKNYSAVIKYAKLAIGKNPSNKILADAYNLLSSAYKMQKEYDLAENAYLSILKIEPKSSWARVNYSSFLRKYRKNYDKAIEQGEVALELMDFGMGHSVLGDAYYAKAAQLHWGGKQYEASIQYFLLAIEHIPTNSNAYYGLGMSYYRVGYKNKDKSQIIQAKEALEKAIQINQEHKKAIKYLDNVNKLLSALST